MPARTPRQSPRYHYEAIREQLRSEILAPGSTLTKLSESKIIARYHVSATTARRVLNELEELGLVERRLGSGSFVRQPEHKQVKDIAVIFFHVMDPEEPSFAQVVQGIESCARHQQHLLHLCAIRNQSIAQADGSVLAHLIARRKLDGLLVLSPLPARDVQYLIDQHIPMVCMTNRYPDLRVSSVTLDWHRQAAQSVGRLMDAGCRRVVMLTGPRGENGVHRAHDQARAGFEAFCADRGIPFDPAQVISLSYAAEHAERAMVKLAMMPADKRPDGIIANTSVASMAAHQFISQSKDWRPCLLGHALGPQRHPCEISTHHHQRIGECAFQLLDSLISHPGQVQQYHVPPEEMSHVQIHVKPTA